jgi:hypothetical protein
VDYSDENTSALPNLALPPYYRHLANLSGYRQNFQSRLLAKYFFVFNFAVKETAARWIFRGADDTMINFRALPEYLAKLDARFDPLREIVVRGHCIVRSGIPYHQGGAGMIFSRRAVELLAPLGEETLRGQTMWEDAQLGWKLGNLSIDLRRAGWSTAFVGTPFVGEDAKALDSGDFGRIGACAGQRGTGFLAPGALPGRSRRWMAEGGGLVLNFKRMIISNSERKWRRGEALRMRRVGKDFESHRRSFRESTVSAGSARTLHLLPSKLTRMPSIHPPTMIAIYSCYQVTLLPHSIHF